MAYTSYRKAAYFSDIDLTLKGTRTHALAGFNLIFSGATVTDYVGFGIT